jgi:hypothetical protein
MSTAVEAAATEEAKSDEKAAKKRLSIRDDDHDGGVDAAADLSPDPGDAEDDDDDDDDDDEGIGVSSEGEASPANGGDSDQVREL